MQFLRRRPAVHSSRELKRINVIYPGTLDAAFTKPTGSYIWGNVRLFVPQVHWTDWVRIASAIIVLPFRLCSIYFICWNFQTYAYCCRWCIPWTLDGSACFLPADSFGALIGVLMGNVFTFTITRLTISMNIKQNRLVLLQLLVFPTVCLAGFIFNSSNFNSIIDCEWNQSLWCVSSC